MVNVPGSNVQPLLNCLEDSSSPPEDKTDAYLTLAEDLAKEDKQYLEDVCQFSSRLMSVLTRDILSERIDLSQAALQAVGYCIYQDRIVSSLREAEMSLVLQDLCKVVMSATDKSLCTRALWGISKQHLSTNVTVEKLPVILETVERALQTFESTTVENEAMEVIYRLVSELPSGSVSSTAGQWSKLVYPLLISSAPKIREKALGILELGLKQILLARQDVVPQFLSDLKGGLLSELAKLFSENKEIFVLRTWTVLVTILGEMLHKGGNFINEMLKIPEQGFRSTLPSVQSMSYTAWTCLIDNFAISPAYIGSHKKTKLLMMPLLLKSGNVVHQDIEHGRLQAWWHLVCVIKPETYATTTAFAEICLPLLQYVFGVAIDSTITPRGNSKDGLRDLTMPVTPVSRAQINTPSSGKSGRTPKRKSVILNKDKFPETFVKQVMQLGCEMLVEILQSSAGEMRKNNRLTEHLPSPILNSALFQEHFLFLLAVVKSALRSFTNYSSDDNLAVSLWGNIFNWIVALIQNGDPKSINDVIASFFLATNDLLKGPYLGSGIVLKLLEIIIKMPTKYLQHPVAALLSSCCQGKPVFLLTDILFTQLSAFRESYVSERFHIMFENLIDVAFEAPTGKLTTVHNVWLVLEKLASTVAKVEDLWRFWRKVTDSVTECVTKTSDVNQGDSLEPDFSLMISLLSFPFKQLLAGGLPVVTTKELDRDLAEFFRLFSRCASLVPAAEANSCIELSKSLLGLVTEEKCKNVRFLDSISDFIYVMMDCVDFSVQNNRASSPFNSRANLTPGGKSRQSEKPLGNLTGLVALSAKALSISYRIDKESCGSAVVAPAVTVLAASLSKLFTSLNNPEQIKSTIAALSHSVSSFISHHCWSSSVADIRSNGKKCHNSKYLLKIEKLWTDILMCLQSRYTAAYDSYLLQIMSELLECTFSHQRRQFKNQTIMFWNATFGRVSYLEYPDSLRIVLQSVMEKTPLTVPGWEQPKMKPVSSQDYPATLQDSEEMTPKENIIKQDVIIANSPKRKHCGSSPGKLKGSFLHKAFNSDKTDRLSPFKNNVETGNKRKSPGAANARRKLPLPLDTADDKDFVVIAPSPKKKRLLTEHQKEVRKAKKLESGHPAFYNMLDQSQDETQFSEWSQSSMTHSFDYHDVENMENTRLFQKDVNKIMSSNMHNWLTFVYTVAAQFPSLDYSHDWIPLFWFAEEEMSDEKTESKNESMENQNEAEVTRLNSEVPRSIKILHDDGNNGLDEVPVLSVLTGGGSSLDNSVLHSPKHLTRSIPDDETLSDDSDVREAQTLTACSNDSNHKILSNGTSCTDLNTLNKVEDDDDEPIPSSQNTSSTSSKQKRRSRIYRTPRNSKKQSRSVENSKTVEPGDSNALVLSNFAVKNGSTGEGTKQNDNSTSELANSMKTGNCEPTLETKKQTSPKMSPISSRTRLRKNPTPYKPKNNTSLKGDKSSKQEETIERNEPDLSTDTEEFSDHQMDDTQLLEKTVTQILTNKSSDNHVIEQAVDKLGNEAPSSPVASSSVRFIHSKNSATGSPLNRPHRVFSSPACSPTTGILKRKGKSETPSPPGKARHVSFAFPLKEEKEIYPMDQVPQETTKPSAETKSFTSIKATPTKSSTPQLPEEESVFPELVECTTPVEQILPSLATSRFSRGLGHVVHAQNIRTIGNLSALTKDQVENLPIRSPKVSTLRRVLRNFHENRAPKNLKTNQLRAIKEISEEAKPESTIGNGLHELEEQKETYDNTEEHANANNTPNLSNKEQMITVATPLTSVIDCSKMLTPKRSRALVKPTTLFESGIENDENKMDKLFTTETSSNQGFSTESKAPTDCLCELSKNAQNVAENENSSTEEKQDHKTKSCMNEEKMENGILCNTVLDSVQEISEDTTSALTTNLEDNIVVESEPIAIETCKEMDIEETGYEKTFVNLPETEKLKQDNQKMEKPEKTNTSVYEVPETEDPEHESRAFSSEKIKHENREMIIDDMSKAGELNQQNQEVECVSETEELVNSEISMNKETEPETCETPAEVMSAPETFEQEAQNVSVEEDVAVEGTIHPYVKVINSLTLNNLTLKSHQELAELPLDSLWLCQEQLMTILSNTTAAIRLKCAPSRK